MDTHTTEHTLHYANHASWLFAQLQPIIMPRAMPSATIFSAVMRCCSFTSLSHGSWNPLANALYRKDGMTTIISIR